MRPQTANDLPTSLSIAYEEATLAAAARGDWAAAMTLRDQMSSGGVQQWRDFVVALNVEVCTRVGRPWVDDADVWRWAKPEDVVAAVKRVGSGGGS